MSKDFDKIRKNVVELQKFNKLGVLSEVVKELDALKADIDKKPPTTTPPPTKPPTTPPPPPPPVKPPTTPPTTTIASLQKKITELNQQIADLKLRNSAQAKYIKELTAENTALTKRLTGK